MKKMHSKFHFSFVAFLIIGLCGCHPGVPTAPEGTSTPPPLLTVHPTLTLEKMTQTASPIPPTLPLPTATETPFTQLTNGQILIVEQGIIGMVSPVNHLEEIQPLRAPSQQIPSPFFASALAFSPFNQVAYIPNTDQLMLWIGPARLTSAQMVWKDEEEWFTNQPRAITLHWITENALILSGNAVYVLVLGTSNTSFRLSGLCQTIGLSPVSSTWAVWCPLYDSKDDRYVVIEQDGSYWFSSDLSTIDTFLASDWAFSPSKLSVLYSDSQNNLWLMSAGNTLNLKYTYPKEYHQTNFNNIVPRGLQWSIDGTKLLIYAKDDLGTCPGDHKVTHASCWVVISASTGDLIWSVPDQLIMADRASLSPDGKWIALSVFDLPERYVAIVNMNSNEIYKLTSWVASDIRWIE